MTTSERSEILNEAIVCTVLFIVYGMFAYFVFFVFSDYYAGLYALLWDDEPSGWFGLLFIFAYACLPLLPFFVIIKHFVDSYERIEFRYRNANEHGKEELL